MLRVLLFVPSLHSGKQALAGVLRLLARGVGQNHDELVAPVSSHRVGLAEYALQELRELDQKTISLQMPEALVHGAEVVQIEHQGRERLPGAGGSLGLGEEGMVQIPTVEETGQRIPHRQVLRRIRTKKLPHQIRSGKS